MTLYHRLRRWLGDDTTKTYTADVPVYHYRVEDLFAHRHEYYGHEYDRVGGGLKIKMYDAQRLCLEPVAQQNELPLRYAIRVAGGETHTEAIGRYLTISETQMGVDTVSVTIDWADGAVVEKSIEYADSLPPSERPIA